VNFLDALKAAGGIAYNAQTGGLRVGVKTNLGPEFTVWDGQSKTGGIAQLLGIKGAIIVRDASGKTLMVQGEPPETNYILTAAYAAGLAYVGYLVWRGLTRKR
jgi:hypothetical protein